MAFNSQTGPIPLFAQGLINQYLPISSLAKSLVVYLALLTTASVVCVGSNEAVLSRGQNTNTADACPVSQGRLDA